MSQPTTEEAPSKPTKKTANDYAFGKLLGEGSFSNVYLAKDVKAQREYAIKVCDKMHIIREKKAELIQREKQVMTIISHHRSDVAPFFVNLYATFQDSERLYFVMTYAPSGELLKLLNFHKTFNKETCRFYAGEILQALIHLHNLKIVHRDLKPENILLNEFGHVLITDFGSAKIMSSNEKADLPEPEKSNSDDPTSNKQSRKNSFVGTAQYVSPEVLQGKYSIVGPPADLWAFGCVIYQFLTGSSPFNGPNEYLIFQKIIKINYDFPPDFDSEAKDIVENLLRLEPGERLGSRDTDRYTSIKSHEFFHGIDFDVLHKQDPPSFDPPVKKENLWSEDGEYLLPGFDPRVIAQRILSGDGDQPIVWANSSVTSGSKDQMELIKNPDPVEPISSEKIDQPEKSPSSRCYCC
ncbi:unnamed protein product [Allacma fusca]|uniref:non-specific serine/threonine protein kinase n=1 Tax=Allacma fusca TaxID=39272 RepID=A0A8J2LRK4_9HEXA|nr:unnamed protein product [Allacma fusca]